MYKLVISENLETGCWQIMHDDGWNRWLARDLNCKPLNTFTSDEEALEWIRRHSTTEML